MRVEFRGLDKRFGKVHALRSVSFDLPSGSRTALIGPNGSGKSTLVRSLLGMLSFRGELRVDDRPVTAMRGELAARIAYVPQIAPRLAAPVRDVVRAVASLRGRSPATVAGVAARLALDLGEIAKRPVRALSGGQRQKLLASLALDSGADLLVLDEPTASMDPESRYEFFRLIEELPDHVTILLCSHRLDEIRRLVGRVVVLAEGELIWQGAAVDYLEAHAEAVVEISATAGADAWLLDNGFVRGASGWWSRSLPVRERAGLLAAVGRELTGRVHDVVARDVERLRPNGQSGPGAPTREGGDA